MVQEATQELLVGERHRTMLAVMLMARLQILLSSKLSSLSGVASSRGSAVAGAAVYLELFDPDLPNQKAAATERALRRAGEVQVCGSHARDVSLAEQLRFRYR